MTAAALRAPSVPPRPELPPDYLVLGRANTENFPVATRLLPAGLRADLMALYGWARLVDELGDNYAGDRLAALDEVEGQLRWALRPSANELVDLHPLVANIAAVVRRRDLPVQPLLDLVQANRQDQAVSTYETYEQLAGYCRLSANPVGRMVLAIFGLSSPERAAWSDSICTALQLVEHWQDVAEDAIVGRTYLPAEDISRFGVATDELVPPPTSYINRRGRGAPGGASPASRALLAFECARARQLLREGSPLIGSVPGRLRFAVAGFVAGGHAALDALAAVDFDIYADTTMPKAKRFAMHMARLLAGSLPSPALGPP